ncbi:uncharacterized protein LOC143047421 isoform X3 [Mytilus galloprovincialis]|uniref:uncharacterized protein LOC143047421 isoform X3 n=1 Tax=Mytilus galloprovincialis TaxID=29158 RepID=UPI003F7B3EE1
MDNLNSIPLPPTSTIPLPLDSEPKLVITSSTSGERSVSTVSADAKAVSGDAEENGAKSSHKEKKKHKKEKHKHKHKHKEKSKDKKKSHQLITPEVLSQHASAIKAAMLKEVQSDSKDGDLSQTIVDDLFKDFLATKMNEIESAYKQAAEKKDSENEVANSVDEMNRLLDDELYSINQNTPSPVKKSAHSKRSHDKKSSKSDSLACEAKSSVTSVQANLPDKLPYTELSKTFDKPISNQKKLSILESSEPSDDSLSSTIKQVKSMPVDVTITEIQIKEKVQDHVIKLPAKDLSCLSQEKNSVFDQVDCSVMKETLERKEEDPSLEPGKCVPKPGKFQLAFKISQTSADLISSGAKKDETQLASLKKNLEEGEVISSGHGSSSDSDSDEKEDVEDAEDEDADISETGSLSDSDKETKDKSKKKKKKKKHKKKKKKHKVAKEKDKDLTENKSKRKHSSQRSTSRSKSPKKHKKSQSPSKDAGKRSRSRSFSPRHGVWRDRSRSKDRKKKERSRSFSPNHGVWRTNKHRHERDRSRERETDKKYDRHHERERHRSRDRENEKRDSERRYGKWRSRSRSKERKGDKSKNDDLRLKIDKAKLREIAMKNALAMAKAGSTVAGVDFASIKAGGKSIDELTEFCARIASKEKLKHRPAGLTSSSSSDEGGKKSDDDEDSLIHHPFKVNEKSITLNIRNAVPLPILNAQEKITQQATLRLQFPVDSGNVHRTKELEWVPVQKTETVKTSVVAVTTNAVALPSTTPSGGTTTTTVTAVVPTVSTEVKLMPVKDEDRVFVETQVQEKPVDIRSIISERIKAARQLAENPKDLAAMSAMQKAQHNASLWASSKNLPGKFIGSTGAQILSQEELMGPDKKRQAWAKKINFTTATVYLWCNHGNQIDDT